MPEIKKLWSKKNSVIFTWAGEEPLELAYDNIRIVVPPRDVIGRVGQGSPYTHEPAYRNGKPVPGTAVIEDIIRTTPEGGYKTVLSIDPMCRYLTRERDDLFARGFNIVEEVGQVEEAMALGIPLWDESQVARAREILNREAQRQKTYKDRGEVPPAALGEHNITWAINHLRNRGPGKQAHAIEDIESALAGVPAVPKPAPSKPAPAESSEEPERTADAFEAAELFREAKKLNIGLGNFELQALLSGSADAIEKLKIRIQAKKQEKAVKDAEAAATVA